MNTPPVLETRHISKSFVRQNSDHPTMALQDISLGIEDHEFVSIVGASGCGKSTFVRILDGLIKPSGGEVIVNGHMVTEPGPERAMVFQNDSLFPWRTVRQNISFGLEVSRVGRKEARERAEHFIKLVGLKGFENYYPHEISGGMRQRVNIARALITDPQILLMDEPFAALDAQTRELVQLELLNIWQEQRKTVVFITHQIDEAVYLSDRVIVFTARPGRIKREIRIDMPRPRPLDVKRTAQFSNYVAEIWALIERDSRQSITTNAVKGR